MKTQINHIPLNPLDISHEFYLLDSQQNIERFKNIFISYNGKRAKENYSLESFNMLMSENRFSYGVFESQFKGDVVYFFGLCDYKNWIIISRFVSLRLKNMPIGLAYGIPLLLEKIRNDSKNGLIMTFNKYNKGYWKSTMSDYRSRVTEKLHKKISDSELIQKANDTISQFKHLEKLVCYRNTLQYISYIPIKNEVLPFSDI